jgi:hypothetical protein
MFTEAPMPQSKLTNSFGHYAFEGEGDTFLRKRNKGTQVHRSHNTTPENCIGPIPMREGHAFRESICINHSFGSSGLNLIYEGLLLGMWKGGRMETVTKLHLVRWTFTVIIIANTFIVCFAGWDSLTQRQRASDLRQHHDYPHLHRLFCMKG